MLNIQKYISCFENIKEANTYLSSKFKIDCIEDTLLSDITNTWYPVHVYVPRLHADLTDPIVQEANCLILDEDGGLVAKAADIAHEVASPEELPQSFILENASVLENGEGTPITIYNLEGEWFVGGQFSADAREICSQSRRGNLSYGFRVKEFMELKSVGEWDSKFINVDPRLCFSFLYVPPDGKLIPSSHEELVLLDVVNLETGEELPQDRVDSLANSLSLMRPKKRSVHGMNSLRHIMGSMPWTRTGITLVDRNNLRVEIANPIYQAIRNAKKAAGKVQPVHVVKIYQACRDEVDMMQIVRMFPEFKDLIKLTHVTVDELWGELLSLWNTAKRERDDKGFAKVVDHHAFKHILFEYRRGNVSNIKEALANLKPHKLLASMVIKHDRDLSLAARYLRIENGGENGAGKND